MAELVDALHSGCSELTLVEVRVLSWAHQKNAPDNVDSSYPGAFLVFG